MPFTENNRVKIDLNICAQTEACSVCCPTSAIEMVNNLPRLIKDCEEPCRDCCDTCPSEAVQMKS